ncbi:MAG TPA: hypothetical protein VG943_15135 [Caulobacterales bacterium]|nr:hypothetical protein [Caulobacterales bacterium]
MFKRLIVAFACVALVSNALAQTGPAISASDRMAALHAINMTPVGGGQVVNACEDRVAPQFYPANIGGPVGTALLVVIPGGPNSATCYGDNPGALFLLKREGAAFRTIFQGQGILAILPSAHSGAHDISIGGPGFSFPVYTWNGHDYAISSRTISDTQFGAGQMLPP